MEQPTIYIDGQEGTTGLRIRQLLEGREDLNLQLIADADRKNTELRREFLKSADVAILCLPDKAAEEAIGLMGNGSATRLIDTSTARRVHDDWVYGLPELSLTQRQSIRHGQRVANPGCYPVGFVLAIRPLIESGLLDPEFPLTVNAVSGYSGGGRKMIASYQQTPAGDNGDAPIPLALYGLDGTHKHLPEMEKFSLTKQPPMFVPSINHQLCGMLVSTPLPAASFLRKSVSRQQVWEIWNDAYGSEPFVNPVAPANSEGVLRSGSFLDFDGANFTNRIDLFVFGNEKSGVILVGRQDNLGKGASGNVVQCLNLMIGVDEVTGLTVHA